jgi:rhodanese-related sulfurtransferase
MFRQPGSTIVAAVAVVVAAAGESWQSIAMSHTAVTETPAATAADAITHFAGLLSFETDCWDVHASLATGTPDFVLLDVRSTDAYTAGHAAGAVSLPHSSMNEDSLAAYPNDTVFVVYCAGPHCNGADKAALRLAHLGRPVKKMIGGVTGWLDEGFDLIPG